MKFVWIILSLLVLSVSAKGGGGSRGSSSSGSRSSNSAGSASANAGSHRSSNSEDHHASGSVNSGVRGSNSGGYADSGSSGGSRYSGYSDHHNPPVGRQGSSYPESYNSVSKNSPNQVSNHGTFSNGNGDQGASKASRGGPVFLAGAPHSHSSRRKNDTNETSSAENSKLYDAISNMELSL